MAEAIIINNERKFNTNFLQSHNYLAESLNKATALSDISLSDSFLSLDDRTIYHHLYAINDYLHQAKVFIAQNSIDSK